MTVFFITNERTCGNGGLFMVLRARWTLAGGPAEDWAEEDEDEESDEDEEEDGVVLLLGPQTLILALPDADDGDERDEVEGEPLLPALPVRRHTTQHLIKSNYSNFFIITEILSFLFCSVSTMQLNHSLLKFNNYITPNVRPHKMIFKISIISFLICRTSYNLEYYKTEFL